MCVCVCVCVCVRAVCVPTNNDRAQTEDFSEGERSFLNTLLVRDFNKRPTLAELVSAIKGERTANPQLKWLSQVGSTVDDSNQAFEKEMQKRIQGYGVNKNMVAWCVVNGVSVPARHCLRAACGCVWVVGRRERGNCCVMMREDPGGGLEWSAWLLVPLVHSPIHTAFPQNCPCDPTGRTAAATCRA